MRPVHAKEGAKGVGEFFGVGNIFKSRDARQFADLRGQRATGFVLREKSVDQADQLAGFAKAREEKIFFELLVVVLDKMTNHGGGVYQNGSVERLLDGEQ